MCVCLHTCVCKSVRLVTSLHLLHSLQRRGFPDRCSGALVPLTLPKPLQLACRGNIQRQTKCRFKSWSRIGGFNLLSDGSRLQSCPKHFLHNCMKRNCKLIIIWGKDKPLALSCCCKSHDWALNQAPQRNCRGVGHETVSSKHSPKNEKLLNFRGPLCNEKVWASFPSLRQVSNKPVADVLGCWSAEGVLSHWITIAKPPRLCLFLCVEVWGYDHATESVVLHWCSCC